MTDAVGLALDKVPLVCPLDGRLLKRDGRILRCDSGHTFDISRKGYVNLLPAHQKSSLAPGDSKRMVDARRRVLGSGLFDRLAAELSAFLIEQFNNIPPLEPRLLIDAGCGEGFYTQKFSEGLRVVHPRTVTMGIDISKPAIAAAARYKSIPFIVASNRKIPISEGSADMITSLFGFEAWQSWSKLQRSGQKVLVVDAGPRHLIELRRVIYPTVRIHDAPSYPAASESGYTLIFEKGLTYVGILPDQQMVSDVLCMTPHGHKMTSQGREAAERLDNIEVTIDVAMKLFERTCG